MFKVKVANNLSNIFNKIDMLPINMQSAISEAVGASESDIRKLFESNDFQNTEIEIIPTVDGVGINVKNSIDEYFKYKDSYYYLNTEVKNIILNKIKSKFGDK